MSKVTRAVAMHRRKLYGPKKHDHRRSLWAIAGGRLLWCYQCGAWKPDGPGIWHRPTGIGGKNPWA